MNRESNVQPKQLMKYWPLFTLILISFLSASAIFWNVKGGLEAWMHYFMGFFFTQFAMLKLFQPAKFADGFQMYDLIAQRIRTYALIYPLIELGLGLAYLSFFLPLLTYFLTFIFMAIGSIGVILSLQRGLDVRCACMGTILDVPLSTVTLTEDIGMGVMSLMMMYMHFLF